MVGAVNFSSPAKPVFDVETERDVNMLTGEDVVRVKYRERGTRRWTRIVVFPEPDQPVAELLGQGHEIAAAHIASQSRVRS